MWFRTLRFIIWKRMSSATGQSKPVPWRKNKSNAARSWPFAWSMETSKTSALTDGVQRLFCWYHHCPYFSQEFGVCGDQHANRLRPTSCCCCFGVLRTQAVLAFSSWGSWRLEVVLFWVGIRALWLGALALAMLDKVIQAAVRKTSRFDHLLIIVIFRYSHIWFIELI